MKAYIEVVVMSTIEPQILEVIGENDIYYTLTGFDFDFLNTKWDKVNKMLVRQYWEEE